MMTVAKTKILREGDGYILKAVDEKGVLCVQKELTKTDSANLLHFDAEIAVLKKLSSHSGFPKFLSASHSSYVREFVDGVELSALKGVLPFETLLDIAAKLIRLISFSHQNKVILADIKPENFVKEADDNVVFIDMSLVQNFDQEAGYQGGSLSYMAPELFYGGAPSPQTDFYALGVTLYELTCGDLPFVGEDINAMAQMHWFDQAKNPAINKPYPIEWGCLILRLMQKKPSDRFLDANDVIDAINHMFHKKISREPEKVAIKELLKEKSQWLEAKEQAKRTIDVVLNKSDKSEQDYEFLVKLLYHQGEYAQLADILGCVSEKTRLHYEAMVSLKTGEIALAKEKSSQLIELGEIKAFNILGSCAYFESDWDKALSNYQKLAAHYQKLQKYAEMIPVLNNLGNIKAVKNELKEAAQYYKQSQVLSEVIGDPKQEATAHASLGYLYHLENKWGLALKFYQKASQIYEWLGLVVLKTNVNVNVINLLIVTGFFKEASHLLSGVKERARLAGNKYLLGHVSLLQGELLCKKKKYELAIKCFEESVSVFHELQNKTDRENALVGLGKACVEAGHAERLAQLDLSEEAVLQIDFYKALYDLDKKGVHAEATKDLVNRLIEIDQKDLVRLDGEEKIRLYFTLTQYFKKQGDLAQSKKYKEAFVKIKDDICHDMDSVFVEKLGQLYPEWKEMESSYKYSQALTDISTQLIAELNIQELLKNILDRLLEFTEAQRGFIILKESNRVSKIAISRKFDKSDIKDEEQQICWTIATNVLETGEPIETLDAPLDQRFELSKSIHSLNLNTVVCLPFVFRDKILGAVYIDSKSKIDPHEGSFIEMLKPFVSQMSVAIWNAQIFEKNKKNLQSTQSSLRELKKKVPFYDSDLICQSPIMKNVIEMVKRVAPSDIPVLIRGDSGVGKERMAKLIHQLSQRGSERFISINCGAIPESLLESELFGYAKGAFTGAEFDKKGLIELANNGTLFLDEIGEMPLAMQVKLLRVLQSNELMNLGGEEKKIINFRLITATNLDLNKAVKDKRFREDLFYRLNVTEIVIPPLDARKEEIPYYVQLFIKQFCEKERIKPKKISKLAMDQLMHRDWPGNIRELENLMYKTIVLTESDVIDHIDLVGHDEMNVSNISRAANEDEQRSLRESKTEFEINQIKMALSRHGGNVSHAAEYLKIARSRLSNLITKHQINRMDYVKKAPNEGKTAKSDD